MQMEKTEFGNKTDIDVDVRCKWQIDVSEQ